MGKNKLEKFAENKTFPNFFETDYQSIKNMDFRLKGNWKQEFFKNDNPIVLELGCGRGEYTVGLAEKYPEKNFIGIDKKGARMWKGCKFSIENGMKNVAFIRTQISYVPHYFDENEISEIWIIFPDPQPKRTKADKRLTSPLYLDFYKKVIHPDGFIHLKTDNESLFAYTLEVLNDFHYNVIDSKSDIYSQEQTDENILIETYYEKKWKAQGHKIYYVRFQLVSEIVAN